MTNDITETITDKSNAFIAKNPDHIYYNCEVNDKRKLVAFLERRPLDVFKTVDLKALYEAGDKATKRKFNNSLATCRRRSRVDAGLPPLVPKATRTPKGKTKKNTPSTAPSKSINDIISVANFAATNEKLRIAAAIRTDTQIAGLANGIAGLVNGMARTDSQISGLANGMARTDTQISGLANGISAVKRELGDVRDEMEEHIEDSDEAREAQGVFNQEVAGRFNRMNQFCLETTGRRLFEEEDDVLLGRTAADPWVPADESF